MKNFLKRTVAVLMIVLMCIMSVPMQGFVGLELPEFDWFNFETKAADESKELVYGSKDGITRAEWLHNLAVVFDMTVEDDSYPDNYYADMDSTHKYYYDILLNVEFGVVNLAPGNNFEPDKLATRMFVAQTLNYCLGYQFDEANYTYSDVSSCEYPIDAQVAVNLGWFSLVGNNFMPNNAVTSDEVKKMLDFASAVLNDRVIDENYDNKYEFSDNVIEIPSEIFTELTKSESVTTITMFDDSFGIDKNDIFAVYEEGIPYIYKADTVKNEEDAIIITATEITDESHFESIDAQGSITPDFSDVVLEESDELSSDVIYINDETGEEFESYAAAYKVIGDSKKFNTVKIKTEVDFGAVTLSAVTKVSNPTIHYSVDTTNLSAKAYFDCDVETSYELSGELTGVKKLTEYKLFTIGGIFNFYLDAEISGSIQTVNVTYMKGGFEYSLSNGFSLIKGFRASAFNIVANVDAKLGIKTKVGLDVPVIEANLYAAAGGKANVEINSLKPNATCINFKAYVYAVVGVKCSLDFVVHEASWTVERQLWEYKNSPLKVRKHYDNWKEVPKCIFGNTSGFDDDYFTRGDSCVSGCGYYGLGGSSGLNSLGEPYTIYEYTLNEDDEATIIKYRGNVRALHIPETIDGYKVVGLGESSFKGNRYVRYLNIPDSVERIESFAFMDCICLADIKLSNNLKYLGAHAFRNCVSLTEIFIPKSINDVGYYDGRANLTAYPFTECDNLTRVTFEEGATEIPVNIMGNSMITSVVIPDSVTVINSSSFRNCVNLSSVKMSDNITHINDFAFCNSTALSDIVLSKSLKYIGAHCFYGCEGLTYIEIPKSLESVGYYDGRANLLATPFTNTPNLKNAGFEEGITIIVDNLFANSSLTEIVIPDTVTSIGKNAFNSSTALKKVELSKNLISIGNSAFNYCIALEAISFPKTVEVIDVSAFKRCDSIKEVTIPSNIKNLGDNAFCECAELEKVYLPKKLTNGSHAFDGCLKLKNVVIEEGIECLPNGILYNTGIETIKIPSSVKKIGWDALGYCAELKTVELNDGLEILDTNALRNTPITSIVIPDTVVEMNKGVFSGCKDLKTVKLSENCKVISAEMFMGCKVLEKIVMPEIVTTLGDHAFKNCMALREITLNKGLTKIGQYAIENCDSLTKIQLPNSVESIGTGAFYDCDDLVDVTLGSGISAVSDRTFEHCDALSEILLPYRVASIGSNAFKDCVKFTSITIPRATTKIADNAFSYLDRLTIYGVEGTYAETYAKEKGIKFVNKAVPATKVELSETELSISKGATANLVLNITPTDFTDAVTWKSSDESIVTIDETGKVTAKGLGTATIKVDVGSVSATCKVTVVQPVTGVNIDKSSLELEALETYQLKVTVNPNNAANKAVKWSTSDETVATVDQNGLVKAIKKGSATIKCEALDGSGKYDTCTVNVKNNGVIAVTVSELESTHDYPVDCTDFWQYTINGASKIDVTFDSRTNIEDGFDYLYIYDGSGKEVGKYTGTSLAGKTITVSGDTVRIQLASDKSGTAWGFKVTDVKESAGIHTHSYTETVTKAATCTGTGIKTFTCTCGDTYTEVIPATGHKNVTTDSGKAPTTTEVGYTAGKYCNDCKTWIEGHNEIPKVDDTHTHKYSSKVTKEATCTENGVRTYTCSCGDSYTEFIDKIEHEYVTETWKATLTTNGGYKELCKYCGKITGEGIYYSPEVIKLSTEKYTYDGKTKKPSVFVEDKMGVDFKEGTDYTVKYESGRKAPGKYTVTITFIGKYEGKKVLEFKILPGKTSKISATQSTSAIKLTWKKVTGADGYRIYQYNSKTGKYEKIKTTTGTTYTIKKLKAGTTYKFAVKAYTKDNGETLWAASSKSIKTATEPAVPNVKITAGTKKATLKWNKVTGATGYVVYLKNSDGDYVKLGSTKSTSYTKKSLKSGKKYYFRVRAYKTVDGKNIYGGYKTYSVKVK